MATPYKLTRGRSHLLTCRLCGKTTTANYFFFCGGKMCLDCVQDAATLYRKLTHKKGIPARGPYRGRKWDGRKRGNWRWKEFPVPKTKTNSNALVCGWDFELLPENVRELARQRFGKILARFEWRHGHEPSVKQRALLVANVVSNLYNGTLRSCYEKWCWYMWDQRKYNYQRYLKRVAAAKMGRMKIATGEYQVEGRIRARVMPMYL